MYGHVFELEYHYKRRHLTPEERLMERLKKGNTITIMESIEGRLLKWQRDGYAGCGELTKKFLKYALNEWPAMKRILEDGRIEVSNNLAEQMMMRIKMSLKTVGNIGSEWSAGHNAFMFSLIESCKLNRLSPAKYIAHILESLFVTKGEKDLEGLLPYNLR